MKLSEGQGGNGESRLFISNNKEYAQKLAQKPWKIEFSEDYLDDVLSFVKSAENFRKKISNRDEIFRQNISNIDGSVIDVQLQQGGDDVNRNYIGQKPHRRRVSKTSDEKKNIKKWDCFRESLVPTITTLEFYDKNTYILVKISHNKNIHKYNKIPGCSFVSLEFFKHFEHSNNIEIQTAKNGGEFKLRKENGYFWPVDGYHNCRDHKCCGTSENPCIWHNYVFEFQGDYWHKEKKHKDLAKRKFYEEKNYKWFEITEFEWNKRKRTLKAIEKKRSRD